MFFIGMLLFIVIACDEVQLIPEEKETPVPVVVPDPELTLETSLKGVMIYSDTIVVEKGDIINILCTTKYAKFTENNIGAPTTISWSFDLIVNNDLYMTIKALNELGKFDLEVRIIEVVEPAYVPTMIDTICSRTWIFDGSSFTMDTTINIHNMDTCTSWIHEVYPEKYEKYSINFFPDGTHDSYFYPYGKSDYRGTWSWSIHDDGKLYMSEISDFVLTDTTLVLIFPGIYVDLQGVDRPLVCRKVFLRE